MTGPATCPSCGCDKSFVLDSRDRDDLLYRRRRCVSCESRWTTYEITAKRLRELTTALRTTQEVMALLGVLNIPMIPNVPDMPRMRKEAA